MTTIDLNSWKARQQEPDETGNAQPVKPSWLRNTIGRLLRLGLFSKILIANAALVTVVAVFVAWLSRGAPSPTGALGLSLELMAVVAIAVALVAFVNAVLLRLALRPLWLLERTAHRVTNGDLSARVPYSPLADSAMVHLSTTFNKMLEATEHSRRKMREVAGRAHVAAEDERRRIALELHDGVAQVLAATRMRLRLARGTDDPDLRDSQLEQICTDLGGTIEEIRSLAQGLRPPALELLGLTAAIDALVRPIAKAGEIEVEVQSAGVSGVLAPEVELTLYRIAQEAISNVERHAKATKVRIRLRRGSDVILLTVEDDGRGFDPAAVMRPNGSGLGLVGMQERAGYVGGRTGIRSEPGRGTQVTAIVPITEEAAVYA